MRRRLAEVDHAQCQAAQRHQRHSPVPPAEGGARVGRNSRGQRSVHRFQRLVNLQTSVGNVGQSPRAVPIQAAPQQPADGQWRIRRQCRPIRVRLEHRRQRVRYRVAAEQVPAREQFVEHHAEAPDVGALIHRVAARLFGGHVGRRAQDHPGQRAPHGQRRR